MKEIKGFFGPYRWLSNFWICGVPIEYEGFLYPTVEHAFQAAKTLNISHRTAIAQLPQPNQAKREGRRVELRADWDNIKLSVMYDCVKTKFLCNVDLRAKLLATGDAYLEETNTWGDRYWGICNGQGQNNLGIILMRVRGELNI